jgi:putative ABC transport system permease protein
VSLTTLVHRPHLYGWNWDASVVAGDGYGNIPLQPAAAILGRDPRVAEWSGAQYSFGTIDTRGVPLLAMNPGSVVAPPIVSGRSIQTADEIVLGAATAHQLHVRVSDSVTFQSLTGPRRLHVVGIATFPTLGQLHAAHTSLGVGAIVAPSIIPGLDRDITGRVVKGLGPNVLFVRFTRGTDHSMEVANLRRIVRPLGGFAGIDALTVQRPAEIVNSASIGGAPIVLAFALVIGATVSLGLALGASVRHRRRDLTILKALGFTPQELAATVSWQATTTVVFGLIVGLPLGVLLGYELWGQFARQLNVVSSPQLPWDTLFAVAVGAIVVGNIVAAFPARAARRVDQSRLLAAE